MPGGFELLPTVPFEAIDGTVGLWYARLSPAPDAGAVVVALWRKP